MSGEQAKEDDCAHVRLAEHHGEHGHACSDCGGEYPDPYECFECALESTYEELKQVRRDRHDLLKHLRRWHNAACPAPVTTCTTCQLIARIESGDHE